MRERIDCPACEVGTLRPVLYGLVTDEEVQEKADRGEVILGGCERTQDSPEWECSACGCGYDADQLESR